MIGTLTKTLKNILGVTENKEIKCTIDELEVPLFECGPGHLTQGYGSFVGVPAPVVLPDDPWSVMAELLALAALRLLGGKYAF